MKEKEKNTRYQDLRVRIQLVRDSKNKREETVSNPDDVVELLGELRDSDRERFIAIYLDSRHRVNGIEEVAVGTINAAGVDPRDVFKAAILTNSARMIVAHNHPSGSADPSDADIATTERLVEAGKLLGIAVLDHVIIAADDFVSLKQRGLGGL